MHAKRRESELQEKTRTNSSREITALRTNENEITCEVYIYIYIIMFYFRYGDFYFRFNNKLHSKFSLICLFPLTPLTTPNKINCYQGQRCHFRSES